MTSSPSFESRFGIFSPQRPWIVVSFTLWYPLIGWNIASYVTAGFLSDGRWWPLMQRDAGTQKKWEVIKGYGHHVKCLLSPLICCDHYGCFFCLYSSRLFDLFLMNSEKTFTLWSMMELSKYDLRENYATFEADKKYNSMIESSHNLRRISLYMCALEFYSLFIGRCKWRRQAVFICINLIHNSRFVFAKILCQVRESASEDDCCCNCFLPGLFTERSVLLCVMRSDLLLLSLLAASDDI